MDPKLFPGSGSGTRTIQSWIQIRNISFRIHNTGSFLLEDHDEQVINLSLLPLVIFPPGGSWWAGDQSLVHDHDSLQSIVYFFFVYCWIILLIYSSCAQARPPERRGQDPRRRRNRRRWTVSWPRRNNPEKRHCFGSFCVSYGSGSETLIKPHSLQIWSILFRTTVLFVATVWTYYCPIAKLHVTPPPSQGNICYRYQIFKLCPYLIFLFNCFSDPHNGPTLLCGLSSQQLFSTRQSCDRVLSRYWTWAVVVVASV